jgi:hypothetical protein
MAADATRPISTVLGETVETAGSTAPMIACRAKVQWRRTIVPGKAGVTSGMNGTPREQKN